MSKHDPQTMDLADLVDLMLARMKHRRESNEPVYYTLHDAAVDEALLNEVGFLRLRAIERSGQNLADAPQKTHPRQESGHG